MRRYSFQRTCVSSHLCLQRLLAAYGVEDLRDKDRATRGLPVCVCVLACAPVRALVVASVLGERLVCWLLWARGGERRRDMGREMGRWGEI